MRIVLASRSPQRRALLEALGVKFEVAPTAVDEVTIGEPTEVVLANARAKAEAAWPEAGKGGLVIAGDTEVVIEGRALGQPADEREARFALGLLSGREHQVLGAIVALGPETKMGQPQRREGVETTIVRFRQLDAALIDAYLESGEWKERAGAYAIQGLGSALVEEVHGDLANVIGLPIGLLLELVPELLA